MQPAFYRKSVDIVSALIACTTVRVFAQKQPPRPGTLEEIIVTATRVETNLQETPLH